MFFEFLRVSKVNGFLQLSTIIALTCTVNATPKSQVFSFPTRSLITQAESRDILPPSIWITPAIGSYGRALGAGASLQIAGGKGWSTGVDFTKAEELCILCSYLPEKLSVTSMLLGYRHVSRPLFFSISAGPSWGKAEHRKPGSTPTTDPGCIWLCYEEPPEMTKDQGVGFKFQTDLAVTSSIIGIGGQLHWIHIPNNSYAGVALIIPMGRLY